MHFGRAMHGLCRKLAPDSPDVGPQLVRFLVRTWRVRQMLARFWRKSTDIPQNVCGRRSETMIDQHLVCCWWKYFCSGVGGATPAKKWHTRARNLPWPEIEDKLVNIAQFQVENPKVELPVRVGVWAKTVDDWATREGSSSPPSNGSAGKSRPTCHPRSGARRRLWRHRPCAGLGCITSASGRQSIRGQLDINNTRESPRREIRSK